MKLTFGKFKGQELSSTPQWYQDWLNNQDWFKKKFANKSDNNEGKQLENALKALKGWNGASRSGQAAYDSVFEWEKEQARKEDCVKGICTCCPDSIYYGL